MPHSHLLNFSFSYLTDSPSVPIRLVDQKNNSLTPVFDAMIDSGSYEIIIPKKIADYLHYDLKTRDKPIHTVGGTIEDAFSATIDFRIGRGGREVRYEDIEICVVNEEKLPVLLGRRPVFDNYKITIIDYERKIILEPRQ